MRPKLLFCLFLFPLILGCSHQDRFVGKWTANLNGQAAADVSFSADGRFTMLIPIVTAGTMKLLVTGTWHDADDKLYYTNVDCDVQDLPPQLQSSSESIAAQEKAQMRLGQEQIETVQFDGNDSFKSTDAEGRVSTFTRGST